MVAVTTTVEPLEDVSDEIVEDLCDAAESAILDGGGFGWLKPPPRAVLGRRRGRSQVSSSSTFSTFR